MRPVDAESTDNRWLGRGVAAVLLGLMIACFAADDEWWPLSGFSLFSQVRGAEQTSWSLYAISGDRAEQVPLASLPASHWGSHHVLPTLTDASTDEQRGAVRAWLAAAGYDPDEIELVRVVRIVSRVPSELNEPAREVSQVVTLEIDPR
jgi:hypothetical protein